MEENLREILTKYSSKGLDKEPEEEKKESLPIPSNPKYSDIPDIFFDDILHRYKITKQEIIVLMFLYRKTWCGANIYKGHGISPLFSYEMLAQKCATEKSLLLDALKKLEVLGLITAVRPGQYFIRKFFLEQWDDQFHFNYHDF